MHKSKSFKDLTASVKALNDGLKTDFLKFSRLKSTYVKSRQEDEKIQKTDLREILLQTAKDLRIV